MNELIDVPVPEALQKARQLIEGGAIVFFKFTCENCGTRQTFDKPNTFYREGSCEECGHITKIKTCGFLVAFTLNTGRRE